MNILLLNAFLTLTVILSAGARPLDGPDPALPPSPIATADLLLHIYQLQPENASRIRRHHQMVLLSNYQESKASSDPNVLLLLENFESTNDQVDQKSPRSTRADQYYSGTDGYVDFYYLPRAKTAPTNNQYPYNHSPPSPVLQPPPRTATPVNKVGRSINTADLSVHQQEIPTSSDEESPDFLSTLVTIPQVWMHDLSHMIIQPLRKDKNPSAERDSFEYFGMVSLLDITIRPQ